MLIAAGAAAEGDEKPTATGLGLFGILIILVCCLFLYYWNDGAVSTSWWGLDKKATYLQISQTEIDPDNKTYVVVLQNAIDKSFWCITVQNKSPLEQGIFKIAKSADKLTLQPVTPFSVSKPALPVEAPKTEKPSPPAAPDDKTKDSKAKTN